MHCDSPIDLTLFVELTAQQKQKYAQDKETDNPIISSHSDKDDLTKDINKLVQDINKTIKLLITATEQVNVEALGEICKQMQETSRTCGFEPLSEVADVLLATLDQATDDMTLIDEQVAALIAVAR